MARKHYVHILHLIQLQEHPLIRLMRLSGLGTSLPHHIHLLTTVRLVWFTIQRTRLLTMSGTGWLEARVSPANTVLCIVHTAFGDTPYTRDFWSLVFPPVARLVLFEALNLCEQTYMNNPVRGRAFCDVHRDILTTMILLLHPFRFHHHRTVSHNSPVLDKTHAPMYYHFSNNLLLSALTRLLQSRTAFDKFQQNVWHCSCPETVEFPSRSACTFPWVNKVWWIVCNFIQSPLRRRPI